MDEGTSFRTCCKRLYTIARGYEPMRVRPLGNFEVKLVTLKGSYNDIEKKTFLVLERPAYVAAENIITNTDKITHDEILYVVELPNADTGYVDRDPELLRYYEAIAAQWTQKTSEK